MIRSLAALALFVAAPAAAVTYDAFASFDAVQGSGGFVYGATDTSVFTPFTTSGSCVVSGTICLTNTAGDYFGAFKGSVAGQSGTITVPADRLLLHPGPGIDAVYVGFNVTTAGTHSYSAGFNQQDTNTAAASVTVTEFYKPFGGAVQLFTPITVDQSQPEIFTGFTDFFGVGDIFGYIVDKNGDYSFDATGVSFTVDAPSAVPEPSTWALLIGGFGLTGTALRRRRAVAA